MTSPASPRATALVIGHRGASGYRPEHTRSAYELAFALGADAVEPDIVATKDGVLVLRHENEISGTTDVAQHPEFASRKTTKHIDGVKLTGWFTEDFTWKELSTLRAMERLPQVRQANTTFDRSEPILRLTDLMEIIDRASAAAGRTLIMVAEIKHASYFESIGMPLDRLLSDEIRDWATVDNLVVESFEQTVLLRIRDRGIAGRLVYLVESGGAPADLVVRDGRHALSYADHLTPSGLALLARSVDGVSFDKRMIITGDGAGVSDLVARTHDAGLLAFTWTLRAENRFLAKRFRSGGAPFELGNWLAEFRLLLGTGIDGVFADQPDLALHALRSASSVSA
ncbi:MAG: glycerophosphodiester phosphodiesterase family protein [Microbacteriaceae bacterium]